MSGTTPPEKEVRFDQYCQTCAHRQTKETDKPCSECLEQGFNLYSRKPVMYKEG